MTHGVSHYRRGSVVCLFEGLIVCLIVTHTRDEILEHVHIACTRIMAAKAIQITWRYFIRSRRRAREAISQMDANRRLEEMAVYAEVRFKQLQVVRVRQLMIASLIGGTSVSNR